MFQTVHLECHQQRSFTLKMHQNRWRLGLCPRPHWGTLQLSPKPPRWIKGRGGDGSGKEGREGEGLWTLTMLKTDWRPWILIILLSIDGTQKTVQSFQQKHFSHVVVMAEFNGTEYLPEVFPDHVFLKTVSWTLQFVQQCVIDILENQIALLLVLKCSL